MHQPANSHREDSTSSVSNKHTQTGHIPESRKLYCNVCTTSEQVQLPYENQDVVRVTVSVLKQLGWTCSRCRQSVKKMFASDICESVASLSYKLSDVMNDIAEIKTSLKQNKNNYSEMTYAATNSTKPTVMESSHNEASIQVLVAVHSTLADKHRRRRTVIVSGIQPVKGVDDCILFSSICEANLLVKPHVTSTQCRRLGRPGGKRPQLLRVTLHSDEEITDLLSVVARQLQCSDNEMVRSSVYINSDLTPAEIQLAYEQRQRIRQLKARPEVRRPTGSTSAELR